MRLSNSVRLACTIVLMLLIQLAAADFSIYRIDPPGPGSNGPWKIFNNDATCGELDNRISWNSKSDVSGKKLGLRCKGTACDYHVTGNPRDWEELEMHFSNKPLWHLSKFPSASCNSKSNVNSYLLEPDIYWRGWTRLVRHAGS